MTLNAEQRAELERRVRAGTSFQRDAQRARIILASEDGESAAAIAPRVGVHARTVERWRTRFRRHGLPGLQDLPRPGPPPKSGSVTRDRKSTRLNSSHLVISYAVFCLKK